MASRSWWSKSVQSLSDQPAGCEYTPNQLLQLATNSDVQLLLVKMTASNLQLYDEQVVRLCSSL